MPGGYPSLGSVCNGQSVGAVTASASGTSVTSGGAGHTKGSWVQLIASTAADCSLVDIALAIDVSSFSDYGTFSVDIGIGAGGSEVVVVADLLISSDFNRFNDARFTFPLQIPAGTRIAARCQCNKTSKSVNVSLTTYDANFASGEGFAGVDALGFNSGSTRGVSITPGATSGVMGSYSQIVASTAKDYVGLFAAQDPLDQGNVIHPMLLDIAIGAGGSEVVLLPQQTFGYFITNTFIFKMFSFIPVQIPAGTRLAGRALADTNSSAAAGLTLYGVF